MEAWFRNIHKTTNIQSFSPLPLPYSIRPIPPPPHPHTYPPKPEGVINKAGRVSIQTLISLFKTFSSPHISTKTMQQYICTIKNICHYSTRNNSFSVSQLYY